MKFFWSWVFIIGLVALGIAPCAAQLQWHQEKDFRWAELAVPREGKPGFTLLAPEQTGITFTNPLDEHAVAVNRVLAKVAPSIDYLLWRTAADSQLQAPASDEIRGASTLHHVMRVLIPHINHRSANFDASRFGADRGEQRER